ncbi:MAG: hypothetical protein ACR2NM_12095, partial [Bythopirellula sp.]
MTSTAPNNETHDCDSHDRESHDREMVEEVLKLTLSCQGGKPTEDECARLSVLLSEDSRAREIYLLACDDTTTLINSAQVNSALAQDPAPSRDVLLKPTTRSLFALAVAASLVIILAGWNMWFTPESSPEGAPVNTGLAQQELDQAELAGRIVSLTNVKWAAGADVLQEWSRFAVGQSIRIEAGVVELMLDNSTEITLEGPADFRLASLDKAILD